MPALDYPVYDADNHLYEPEDAFTRHMDAGMARRAIQWAEVRGRKRIVIAGQLSDYIPNPTFERVAAPGSAEQWYRGKNPEGKSLQDLFEPQPCQPEYRDRDRRLEKLDEQGVHSILLHPTLASAMEHRLKGDAQVLHATVHAFNQWMDEDWGFHYQDRIFGVPMMSLMDVDRACAELDWCLERGARAVGLRPAPVPAPGGSRSPGARVYDPFWARVNESGIFVAIHSSDSGYEEYADHWDEGGEYLPFKPKPFRTITMGDRPITDMMAALICHGVFERHPNVRIATIENGSGWVHPLLARMGRSYALMPNDFPEPPLDTFRRHVWVAPFYEENIRALADEIGVEHVVFGSDFPHPEGLAEPLSFLDELRDFDAGDVQKIMSANLAGLLEPSKGPTLQ